MEFHKYQHVEKLGSRETEGIEEGDVYIFPKIDGTNASLWVNNERKLMAGSRKRQISLESDNMGFYSWAKYQHNIIEFLCDYPEFRLYGEWLVPHTFKDYRETAWNRFFVFDVCYYSGSKGRNKYIPYEEYKKYFDELKIDYIPPIAIIKNPTTEQIYSTLEKNNFLVKDGSGNGEGIVLKNYYYSNVYGRQTWAKVIASEFKEKHNKVKGIPKTKDKSSVEERIVSEFCTEYFIKKEVSKIITSVKNEGKSLDSKMVPRLLHTIYNELIKEESFNFIKKYRHPKIDFGLLNRKVTSKIKQTIPEYFK
jgi:hypothetical protein